MEKLHSQPSRWWDWAAISLQFILLQTVASRLVATTWTPFLYLIQTFTYMGFVVGTALGYSSFQRRTVRWLTFFYMLVMLPLQWTLVIDQNASLEEQFLSVAGRFYFSTSDFLMRRPVEDPLFFVAVMSIAFWIISSWAGFALVRNQNYLGAVLPAAIGLLIIQNYDNGNAARLWFLAFFAFVALLLLGRLQFLQNKLSWRQRRIFLSPDNSVDLTSSMAVAAGLIIVVAWTIPASLSSLNSAVETWNQATRPWRELTQKMENAVSALESPGNGRRGEFFGSELALGRGFPLSDLMMFQVETPDIPREQKPPRYYWRGRTYDRFVNGQWYTTGTVREEYSPSVTNPFNVNTQEKTPAHFVFNTGNTNFSLLYSPAQPIWVSRPGVTFAVPAEAGKDIIAWHAYPSLRGGETYQLDAVLINPNRQQLQEAGTGYPEWVAKKYLQLPKDFSPRIQELAQELTKDSETPYQKALAITSYLRENIKYSQTISEPPRNKDRLEWILFDYKQAYCVYYASAEILMLRSVGVPARMAVGFAQGEGDGFTYTVRRFNAHAWPEVYFPGIGWVEFEPTAGQAPLDRPLPPQDSTDANDGNPFNDLRTEDNLDFAGRDRTEEGLDAPVEQAASTTLPLHYLLPLLAVCAVLTIFLSRRYDLHTRVPVFLRTTLERTGIDVPIWIVHWEKWVKLSPIEKAFESVNFGLRQLDQPVPVHITPVERATKLTRILPDKADEIKVLLDEHQTSLYTSRVGDVTQARHAALDIRKQVIIERIRHLFFGKPIH
ncbi:MAG: transglutaminase domain-containing protein [Chloroflexi bacterium]|nr:MAG: transglutaminase domain-containing protein [Chloroflexota bacterium]